MSQVYVTSNQVVGAAVPCPPSPHVTMPKMSKPNGSRRSSFYGDDLASLHNLHYSIFVTEAAPGAIRMLRAAGIKGGLVCDLGCGGGQLSAALLKAGYEVVGVDLS